MIKRNFIIQYTCYDKSDGVISSGKMRAKNKFNAFEAQASFEKHLQKKHSNFGRLVVTSCKEESIFDSIFGDNPFGSFFKNR